MAAITALTLPNGEASPVTKTFTPMDCTSALATWTDRSSGISIGMPTITQSLTVGGDVNKVIAKVVLPILEAVAGDDENGFTPAPKVAYTLTAKLEMVLPARSTLAQRKDLTAFIYNLVKEGPFETAVYDYERPF
jgi:hypothetical protein